MSVADQPPEPVIWTLLSPAEALQAARPLPSGDDMAVEGLTDDEWDAFEQVLADR